MRDGIRRLPASEPSLQVVGKASHGQELLSRLPTTPTDVVLLDRNMPVLDQALLPAGRGSTIPRQAAAGEPAAPLTAVGPAYLRGSQKDGGWLTPARMAKEFI